MHQSNTNRDMRSTGVEPLRVLSLGLAVTVALWVVWFGLHMPGLDLGPGLLGPATLGAWLILAVVLARAIRPGLLGAAIAGVLTAALSLMAFGSVLVEQPDPSAYASGEAPLRPAAALLVAGFLALGAAIGAVGALVGGAAKPAVPVPTPGSNPWPARLAWIVALSFVPLVLLGGLVTSTESGMAVTGWPDTFGANMFLYPISLMSQPRVFLEHSHRLFGSLAGMSTLLLLLAVLVIPETRRRFGPWTGLLFVAVCLQGVFGGIRVEQNNAYLGAVHGALGQVVLAYAATLALWMSPSYQGLVSFSANGPTRRVRTLTTAALHISIVQLLLGATFRHLRRGESEGAMHVLMTHVVLSLVVVALVIMAGAVLTRFAREHRERLPAVAGRIKGTGAALHALVTVQFLLGWVALLAVLSSDERGSVPLAEQLPDAAPVPLPELLAGTAHQANGAAMLVVLMLAWAWGRRVHRAAQAG